MSSFLKNDQNNVIGRVRLQNSLSRFQSYTSKWRTKEVNLLLTFSGFQKGKNWGLIKITENTEAYPSCQFYFIFNEQVLSDFSYSVPKLVHHKYHKQAMHLISNIWKEFLTNFSMSLYYSKALPKNSRCLKEINFSFQV